MLSDESSNISRPNEDKKQLVVNYLIDRVIKVLGYEQSQKPINYFYYFEIEGINEILQNLLVKRKHGSSTDIEYALLQEKLIKLIGRLRIDMLRQRSLAIAKDFKERQRQDPNLSVRYRDQELTDQKIISG